MDTGEGGRNDYKDKQKGMSVRILFYITLSFDDFL